MLYAIKAQDVRPQKATHFDPGLKGTTGSRFNRLVRMQKWRI